MLANSKSSWKVPTQVGQLTDCQLLVESFDQRPSLKLFRQIDLIENQIPTVLGKINLNRTQVKAKMGSYGPKMATKHNLA